MNNPTQQERDLRVKAKLSSWAPLVIVAAFPMVLGIAGSFDGQPWEGVVGILLGALLISYNSSYRAVISDGTLSAYRFGFRLWSIDIRDSLITKGVGGEVPVIRALRFSNRLTQGVLLIGLFHKADVDRLIERCVRLGARVGPA